MRAQYVRLCNPMDCSPPGSSAHGLIQARILEWVATPSSGGCLQPRDRTRISFGSCRVCYLQDVMDGAGLGLFPDVYGVMEKKPQGKDLSITPEEGPNSQPCHSHSPTALPRSITCPENHTLLWSPYM